MKLSSGFGRSPRREMTAKDVVILVDALEHGGITVWLDGGWAVDAALGEQTRPHDDLDLVVDLSDVERVQSTLAAQGFALASGGSPKSFELVDSEWRQVDVHPVAWSDSGDGFYLMENDKHWVYPAAGFSGSGIVDGRRLRCLTPEVQVMCHTGYEPHRSSYDDVWALSRRFGIRVPLEYARPRESYPIRS